MDCDDEGINDSELCVKLSKDSLVYHIREILDPQAELHQLQVEEIWQREDPSGSHHLLGRGTFGSVYKETCIRDIRGAKLGRFRAVKVIERGDQVTKLYYREELKALAKFSAPKYRSWFVESFGWYEAMGRVFINMEHLEHRDLQRYLDRQFSERETNQVAFQVTKGLAFMHQNGFIHRDLKPANLLVVEKPPEKEEWWVKISDFGISKRSTDGRRVYSTGNIGTLEYMAPEVCLFRPRHNDDRASYTVTADMWSLGAICVRLITGKPAFDLRGLVDYFDHGARFDPEDALAGSGTTQAGCDFVRKIMDRDPELRLPAHKAIEHAWMAPSWWLSPGVPNSETVAPLASPSKLCSSELADEYRATAQWDSEAVVKMSAGDPKIMPAAAAQKPSSSVMVVQSPEDTPGGGGFPPAPEDGLDTDEELDYGEPDYGEPSEYDEQDDGEPGEYDEQDDGEPDYWEPDDEEPDYWEAEEYE